MIYFDKSFTLAEIARAARLMNARFVQDMRGNVVITPNDRRKVIQLPVPKQHSNEPQPAA